MDMILIGTQWNMQKKTARIRHAVDFGSEDFDVFIISVSTHKPDDIFSSQMDGILTIALEEKGGL